MLRRTVIGFSLFATLAAVSVARGPRVVIVPRFTVGQTLEYQIESSTTTAGKTVTPITNGEGPTESSLTISMRERLEVLGVTADPQGDSIRFRLTWDDSHAQSASDALDPTAADPAIAFDKLDGQSLEFTLAPTGAITGFKGLEDILPGGIPPAESVAWISALVAPAQFPAGGIAMGQQWKAEHPIAGAPLAGLFWQTQSSYDRDEPCPRIGTFPDTSKTAAAAQQSEQCVAILTQMAIARHGSGKSDETPYDYLRNGLRSSGTWTGSGQELGLIAINSGLLMSDTETSTQNIDYTIMSAASGSSVHYTAKVQSQTGISLVAESQPQQSKGL